MAPIKPSLAFERNSPLHARPGLILECGPGMCKANTLQLFLPDMPRPPGSGRCGAAYSPHKRGRRMRETKRGGQDYWVVHRSAEQTATTGLPVEPLQFPPRRRCGMHARGLSVPQHVLDDRIRLPCWAKEIRRGVFGSAVPIGWPMTPVTPPLPPHRGKYATRGGHANEGSRLRGCRPRFGPDGPPTCGLACIPDPEAVHTPTFEIFTWRRGRPPGPTPAMVGHAGGGYGTMTRSQRPASVVQQRQTSVENFDPPDPCRNAAPAVA